MNVVDSSAWLEYFENSTNGKLFAPVIQDIDQLVVPTISMYEVFKRVLSQRDAESALKAIGLMSLGKEVDLTREIAVSAAALSLELKLPMADSIILATAKVFRATLWTQDEHFKNLDGVKYVEKN